MVQLRSSLSSALFPHCCPAPSSSHRGSLHSHEPLLAGCGVPWWWCPVVFVFVVPLPVPPVVVVLPAPRCPCPRCSLYPLSKKSLAKRLWVRWWYLVVPSLFSFCYCRSSSHPRPPREQLPAAVAGNAGTCPSLSLSCPFPVPIVLILVRSAP